MRPAAIALFACALAGLAPALPAQLVDLQPGRNFVAEPNFGAYRTEQADAGDADLDGDLDVILANGGEGGPQIPRIYINDSTGAFTDETASRLAGAFPLKTRDIEFFDAENDGDMDFMIACDKTGSSPPGAVSRFYVNLGGSQRGAVGYFEEGTDDFWGSLLSVPSADQVFGGDAGPFYAWASECDFADLDDDGDLDLFFDDHGPGAFSGQRDSRVFLNDGSGSFDELWPWADPGSDTKWISYDLEIADLDGDFDLDLVAAHILGQARVFLNNRYGTALGAEGFHDITQHALLATGAGVTGSANYEAELGDIDADGDFDLWMGNYSGNFERLLRNNGPDAGGFAFTKMEGWLKNDTGLDENEADFGDFDNDGDLDVFLANFSGTNFLFQSSLAQGLDPGTQGVMHRTGLATGQAPAPELPSNFNGGTSLDGEWFDFDGDGDLDILLANDSDQGNWMFRNVLGVPDTHAPAFVAVTVQADKPNGTDTAIHARARDNAPLQLFRFYAATLVYTVDGGAPQSVDLFHQGGQQYRGVIPAQTDATVAYHVELTDLAGNTAVSGTSSFEQGAPDAWTDLGSGLAGISGIPALAGTGPLTTGSPGTLVLTNAKPSSPCALFVSLVGASAPFKCGTLVPVPIALQIMLATNGSGGLPLAWANWPSGLSGASLYFQYAIADAAAVCGTSLSNALRADVP